MSNTNIVTISGKGGVGKTTITALLVDELARRSYSGRVLIVDGDPAMTLHFAIGCPPPAATLAEVRDSTPLNARTVRQLPAGVTPAQYVRHRLEQADVITRRQLRKMTFDMMAMGQGEGAGCYCAINNALSEVLETILDNYNLVIVDNEAGLEHLNRYRIKQVGLFLIVSTLTHASVSVARQIEKTIDSVGMETKEKGLIINRVEAQRNENLNLAPVGNTPLLSVVRTSHYLEVVENNGVPAVKLPDSAPQREDLAPVVEKILCA